ncbi:MAG: biopolymer transporter ExbD [Candidatus Eisenbacteria bacterium]|nr:biopolymer transporter ExbD [Candidatus Eisenbacteria bacterium]
MRKRKRRRSELADIPEASTGDIAFLLLIFFIVSTSFPDIGLPLILPSSAGVVKEVARSNVLEIVTAKTGEYYVGKATTPTPLADVARQAKQDLIANDKLILLLASHPDAPYGKMIDLLDEMMLVYDQLDNEGVSRERRISIKMIEYQ